jgi:uncharacterized iron-regulated membrane protein
MFKYWLLKLHRWITLIFALPLATIIVTGLMLSFEPMLFTQGAGEKLLTIEKLNGYLKEHDPDNKARAIAYRSYAQVLTIDGVGDEGEVEINVKTGEELDKDSTLTEMLRGAKGIHQHLIYDLGWLVTASTFAMMALIVLGILMGLPRFANSVSGWHKGTAWVLLPLIILSPLTGLFLAYRITFITPQTGARPSPITLQNAIKVVVAKHDIASIIWIRPQGGGMMARVNDGGEFKTMRVLEAGLSESPRNLPRLIHEGTWSSYLAPLLNVLVSLAFTLLMVSGLIIWTRKTFRKKKRVKNA